MKSETTLDRPIIFSTQYKHHHRDSEPYCTECILKFMGKNGNIFVCYGYSIASEGRPFNKKIGRTIAHGRAEILVLLLWNEKNDLASEFCLKQKIRDVQELYAKYVNFGRLTCFLTEIGDCKVFSEEMTPDEFEQEHSAMVAS
ncbi:MAG: hypothetical protein WC516_09460 [Patescibacteria group bacterium]|jgi:hypothetical protein